jgi:UDP-glucose:(heptosyl)LPS alpha-1,3-glucosyltransferase
LKEHPTEIVLGLDRNRSQTHIRAGNGVHAAYLQSRLLTEGRLKYGMCLLNPLHREILRLEKEAFEHPALQKIFTNSHMVKHEIMERFSTDPSKIFVLHNGVEWKEMEEDFALWPMQKMAHCKRLGLDPNQLHLLFIGNGYLRKGLKQLLHALSLLKSQEIHLSIIGKDKHQPLYEKEALELGLRSQVRFFGSRTDIRAFYQIGDILAIPSFYDPFANVTVEALAMGLFVLSSKSNGGSEVLTPQTGLVIDNLQDVASIAESLHKALLHRKTSKTALLIRESVEHLNYQTQLKKLVEYSLA